MTKDPTQGRKRKMRCWDAVHPLPLKHHNTKVLMLRDVLRKALQHLPLAAGRAPCAAGLALPVTHLPVLAAAKQDTQDVASGTAPGPLGCSFCRKLRWRLKGLGEGPWPLSQDRRNAVGMLCGDVPWPRILGAEKFALLRCPDPYTPLMVHNWSPVCSHLPAWLLLLPSAKAPASEEVHLKGTQICGDPPHENEGAGGK